MKNLSKIYSENDLVIPALYEMFKLGSISTTELIERLVIILKPSGHDTEIIPGRHDTYFSQKVRNLEHLIFL